MIKLQFLQIISVFLTALFITTQASSRSSVQNFELGKEWQKSSGDWGLGDGTWKLKSNKDIYVTAMSHDLIYSDAELEPAKVKDVLLEMTKGRNAALGLMGINDWHITGNSLKKEKNQTLLTIEGGYHDTHSKPVEFKEVHIWKKQKYETLMINYPADTKFGSSEKSTQVLNRFISSVSEGGK